MKKIFLSAVAVLVSISVFAAETNSAPAEAEVNYTKAIEGRTADILKVLALSDTNKAAKVHDIIIDQYRALNAWHDANDAKLKASWGDTNAVAQIQTSLKALHN